MNREVASLSLTEPLINDIRSVFRTALGKTAGELPAMGQLQFMQERWRPLDTAVQRSGSAHELLIQLIEQLRSEDEMLAAVIRARFVHGAKGRAVAQQLGRSLDQINRLQKKGLSRLAAYLLTQDQEWTQAQLARRRERLPAAGYRRFFGLQGQLEILAALLQPSETLVQLAVVGIGGIGKSTLLHQAVLQALERAEFAEILWVQISNQFPAPVSTFADMLDQLSQQLPLLWDENPSQQQALLRRLLAEKRCLLVLDNLEREADFNHILREFQGWTGPSVILYGARVKPPVAMGVALLELNQLPPDDARDLLNEHLAAITEASSFEPLGHDAFRDVYALVGGNPLALKLVAGLIPIMPLANILQVLRAGKPGPGADMYQRIFQQAWGSLSQPARQLLMAMPLVDETGGTPDHLQAVAELDESAFWLAIQELSRRCLIEIRGNINQKRYGIHRLTAAFIEGVISAWSDEDDVLQS